MKSKKRKTGGAYRRMKRAISLHAKPGKDRKKQTTGAKIEAVVKERTIKEHSNGEKEIQRQRGNADSR